MKGYRLTVQVDPLDGAERRVSEKAALVLVNDLWAVDRGGDGEGNVVRKMVDLLRAEDAMSGGHLDFAEDARFPAEAMSYNVAV